MIAVDTLTPALASAFSAAPSTDPGDHVVPEKVQTDEQGNVYSTTGNTTTTITNAPVTAERPVPKVGDRGRCRTSPGTYTPWNYCQMDQNDADLSGGAAVVLPDQRQQQAQLI